MSLWTLEVFAFSLGAEDSPASTAKSFIFSLKDSLAPSGCCFAVAFSS